MFVLMAFMYIVKTFFLCNLYYDYNLIEIWIIHGAK